MPRTKQDILKQIDSLQSELRSAPDDQILVETDDKGSFFELRFDSTRNQLVIRYAGVGNVRPNGTVVTTRVVAPDQVALVANWINHVLPTPPDLPG